MFSISINYNRSLMSFKQLAEVVCLKENALAMLLSAASDTEVFCAFRVSTEDHTDDASALELQGTLLSGV
ncbi:hypothetical protein ACRRTK_021634 [Alexandromys fortis]